MTSAEGVTGRDRKPLNSQHASVDTTKNGDVKDRVLMDLVNGFVQEILRKGMAKYQEDIKSQREHNVTVGGPWFANCKEKTCKPPFFSLVCNKQPIRHAVYRVIFAPYYFRPCTIANGFAQSWSRPDAVVLTKTLFAIWNLPRFGPLTTRAKDAKIKRGRLFPCIQHSSMLL